jgi:hypothetical protein
MHLFTRKPSHVHGSKDNFYGGCRINVPIGIVPSSVMLGLIRHPVTSSGASFLDSGLRRNDGGEAYIHRQSIRQSEYYYDNRSNSPPGYII